MRSVAGRAVRNGVSAFVEQVFADGGGLLDLDLVLGELTVAVEVHSGDGRLVDDVELTVAVDVDGRDRAL